MAYQQEIVRAARQQLAQKKADLESLQLSRLHQAYAELPRIREIDIELRRSMALAAQAAFLQGGGATEAMEQVKQANLALQAERKELLQERFGPDFLNEEPLCPHCGGSGYIGTAMCSCLTELCRQEQTKQIAVLADPEQRFENFRLEYYPDTADPKYGVSPRFIMEKTLAVCRKYARQFSMGSGNLLFVGGTGLGKTFLSASIAREVAEKGFAVCYETAAHLFSKLEKNRFNPDEQSQQQIQALTQCDLLIVDDLGTELPGNFVTAALYTLVNDRLLAGKPMVISANLTIEELGRRYSPQIASRLQGSFTLLSFVGRDIRVLKNK